MGRHRCCSHLLCEPQAHFCSALPTLQRLCLLLWPRARCRVWPSTRCCPTASSLSLHAPRAAVLPAAARERAAHRCCCSQFCGTGEANPCSWLILILALIPLTVHMQTCQGRPLEGMASPVPSLLPHTPTSEPAPWPPHHMRPQVLHARGAGAPEARGERAQRAQAYAVGRPAAHPPARLRQPPAAAAAAAAAGAGASPDGGAARGTAAAAAAAAAARRACTHRQAQGCCRSCSRSLCCAHRCPSNHSSRCC